MKDILSFFLNKSNWTIDNYLTVLSIIFILVGGIFAYSQWQISNKIRRAEFIDQIIQKLRFDEEMVSAMYTIEYNYNWYNQDFHNSGELEYTIDKLLSYLSYICYLFHLRNISKKEILVLRYELNRTCSSPLVQHYLWNLYHFAKKTNSFCTFQYLIDYGIQNRLIDKVSFLDIHSKAHPKYLNF